MVTSQVWRAAFLGALASAGVVLVFHLIGQAPTQTVATILVASSAVGLGVGEAVRARKHSRS